MISIPIDKQGHFFAGGFIFGVFAPAFGANVALLLVLAAAALKEASDAFGNWRDQVHGLPPSHDVSFGDFGATSFGGFAAAIIGFAVFELYLWVVL